MGMLQIEWLWIWISALFPQCARDELVKLCERVRQSLHPCPYLTLIKCRFVSFSHVHCRPEEFCFLFWKDQNQESVGAIKKRTPSFVKRHQPHLTYAFRKIHSRRIPSFKASRFAAVAQNLDSAASSIKGEESGKNYRSFPWHNAGHLRVLDLESHELRLVCPTGHI